jgi:hypothetical protein
MPHPDAPLAAPPRRALRRLATAAALTAALAGACASGDRSDSAAVTRQAAPENGRYRGASDDQLAGNQPASPAGTTAPVDRVGLAGLVDGTAVDNRKIVRTGHLALVVATYDATRDQLEAIVREAGGFVDSTRVDRAEGQVSSATIVVRIPAKAFGDLLPRLRALGDIQQESTDAADITEAYTDNAGRLAGARALEKRLLELAATGTGSVGEVLEVERELSRIRGEIEQLEGRMRVWNDQVALSTLTITLSTRRPELAAAAAPSFGRRVSLAWHDSIGALGSAAEGLSIALVALLPWLPLLAPLAYFAIRFLRRRMYLPRAVAYMPAAHAPPPTTPDRLDPMP